MPKTSISTLRKQRGNGLIFAMLGMAIVSAFLAAYMTRAQDQRVLSDGSAEGGIGTTIAAAAATYVTEQYASLQPTPAVAVTKNGFTLGAASALTPTVNDLNSLGYLTNTNGAASFTNGNYVIQIQRTPPGCVGPACDLTGLIYLDTPVRRNAANEINGNWISGWLKAAGANGGYSTPGNPAQITGPGWTTPNPVAGTPAGIVAIRFGFGSSGLGQFARITETRPVDFQNNFQVGGTSTVAGASTLNGAVAVNNTLGVTGASTLSGAVAINSTLGVTGAALLNSTLGVTGAVQAASLNTSGDTVASGNTRGTQIVPTGSFTPGSGCANAGALANNAAATGWVACQNGAWVAVATQATAGGACAPDFSEATTATGVKLVCLNSVYVLASSLYQVGLAGDACTNEGQQGYDRGANYIQLICRQNPSYTGASLQWYRLQDLTSFKEWIGGGTYAHGVSITKPPCAAVGNSPRLSVIDLQGAGSAGSTDGTFNEKVIDNGASWTISLTDGSGAALTTATKQVNFYCYTY